MSKQLEKKTKKAIKTEYAVCCLATQDLSLQSFVQILLLRLERRCGSCEQDDDDLHCNDQFRIART